MSSPYDALLEEPKKASPYDALLSKAPSPYDALLAKPLPTAGSIDSKALVSGADSTGIMTALPSYMTTESAQKLIERSKAIQALAFKIPLPEPKGEGIGAQFTREVENIAGQAIAPAGLAGLAITGGIGQVAPLVERGIAAGFSLLGAEQAYQKWKQGDKGGAVADMAGGALAGVHAANPEITPSLFRRADAVTPEQRSQAFSEIENYLASRKATAAGLPNTAEALANPPPSLTPALKVGDQIVKGNSGDRHADIMSRESSSQPEKAASTIDAFGEDENHVFVDHQGNVLDRDQGGQFADIHGLRDPSLAGTPLHSEHLNETAQAKTETPPQSSAPADGQPPAGAGRQESSAGGTPVVHGLEDISARTGKAVDLSKPEQVLAPAVRSKDGQVAVGAIHAEAAGNLPEGTDMTGETDLFYTTHGRLVTRAEAAELKGVAGELHSSTTRSMGPGAAAAGEISTEGEGRVGARHESINARADAMGFPSIERGAVDNPADMVAKGREVYDSMPVEQRTVELDRLSKTDPQKITDAEFSFLRAHQRQLYEDANAAWQAARNSDDPALAQKAADAEQARHDFDAKVIKPYGTAFASKGRSLQGEVDIDSGNFIQTRQRFEDTHGRPPTPQETKQLENLTDQVQGGEAQVEKQKEAVVKAGDEAHAKPNESKDPLDKVSSSLDKIAHEILTANPEFNESQLSTALAGDPRVKAAFPDLTPDQIEELASRYGQSRPVSNDPVRIKLIDLKRQWLEQAKQRDMAAGSAPRKTGTIQGEVSVELRAEMKRTNEAKRRGGFQITDPEKQLRGALDAAKTRSNNTIADLQREIDAKERTVKSKTASPTDPELEALKQKLAGVRARHQEVFGEIDTQALRDKFSGKTDSKFTPEESKQIWEQARNRITNLRMGQDFAVAIRGLSEDLGLTPEQVMSALSTKEKVKVATDEMWFRQSRTRKLRNQVDEYVRSSDDPKFKKLVKGVPDFLFGTKIGFGLHNLALPLTHGSSFLFKPTGWAKYLSYYGDNIKASFGESGEAFTERTRQMVTSNPNYARQLRSGLAVSSDKITDAEQAYVQSLGKKIFKINPDSAFVMLKDFRQKVWDSQYAQLSDTAKNDPEILKEVSSLVNTLTNGDTGKFGQSPTARKIFFAPQKMAAEIKGTLLRPAKLAGTAAQLGLSKVGVWTEPTAAQMYAAKMTMRNAGEITGTYLGLLAVNAAINKVTGNDKEKINFTDPSKPDWLRFKVMGQQISPMSGSLSALRTITTIASALVPGQKVTGEQLTKRLLGYFEGKLSPSLQPVLELGLTKKTFDGEIVPYAFASNEKVPAGKRQLSMLEYGTEKILPIPAEEAWDAVNEVMLRQGLSPGDIRTIKQGLVSGGAGTLGLNLQPDDTTEKSMTPRQRNASRKKKTLFP